MKIKRNHFFAVLGTALIFLQSCGGPSDPRNSDTATKGTITISADESLKPIVDAEKEVFESIYPEAHINIVYTSEYDAVRMMCEDSVRMAIVTRDLLPEEKASFGKTGITPRYSPFAYDAVAVVLHSSAKDTVFTTEQLAKILDGTYRTWKDVNPKLPADPLQVVFDSPKSGIIRQVKDSLLGGKELAKHCFAVKSNMNVIGHIENNPGTIGLIGVAWISDQDDSVMHSFNKRMIVASLVPADPAHAEAPTMKPYQAYIALKQYPLWRKVQIISREARVGLGTGFASFIASDRGQRIVLKSGLVPAQAPVRMVEIKNSSIQ